MTTIASRIAAVRSRIEAAAHAARRDPASIRLLAVSKYHPADAVREAYEAGLRSFGENYAQELADKATGLSDLDEIEWHMIGHLQTNKARLVAPIAHTVQSVDSTRLALELGKRAAAANRSLQLMIEVNIAGEASKSGCEPEELESVLAAIRSMPALSVRGLMTMPPYTEEPRDAQPHFARLRALRDQHGGPAVLPELSMGMSHDLEVAIAEGATMVRVGTAIFGERPARSAPPA